MARTKRVHHRQIRDQHVDFMCPCLRVNRLQPGQSLTCVYVHIADMRAHALACPILLRRRRYQARRLDRYRFMSYANC